MIRVVLGVVAGFVVWSVLWLGSDQVLRGLWKDWRDSQVGLENAMFNNSSFVANTVFLLVNLVRSVIFSLMAGFLAAFIAGENRRAPLALGILLFLFGLMIQIGVWNYLPVWYHVVFLLLLVPAAVAGGKLKKPAN